MSLSTHAVADEPYVPQPDLPVSFGTAVHIDMPGKRYLASIEELAAREKQLADDKQQAIDIRLKQREVLNQELEALGYADKVEVSDDEAITRAFQQLAAVESDHPATDAPVARSSGMSFMQSQLEQIDTTVKRRAGRPPGSKNKKKPGRKPKE